LLRILAAFAKRCRNSPFFRFDFDIVHLRAVGIAPAEKPIAPHSPGMPFSGACYSAWPALYPESAPRETASSNEFVHPGLDRKHPRKTVKTPRNTVKHRIKRTSRLLAIVTNNHHFSRGLGVSDTRESPPLPR
jgi:hypothetical protein